MRPIAIVIKIINKITAFTLSIFITIVNTIATEIRMSNFYLLRKWNHFIGHQLQINTKFFFN